MADSIQAEYDSDLEGQEQQIIIHNGTQSNTTKTSKKRTFNEMEDNDNHYSSKHSNSKAQKFDHESNDDSNDDINAFINDSDHSDEDDIQESDNGDIKFTVDDSSSLQDVEFEMKDMAETYYHEIKDILSATQWDQKKLNVVQLTDTIINQQEIGGVLTSQTSVLGFVTLLSFKKYHEHLSLAHVKRFLLNKCKQAFKKKKFENYFCKKYNIGLLLHERPLNSPYELVPHIWESLYKDFEYATDIKQAKHLNDKDIESFKCDYILMVVRYRWIEIINNNNNKHEKDEEDEDDDIRLLPHLMTNNRNKMKLVYEHLEDDLFVKKAEFQFDFERNDKVWNVLLVKMNDLNGIVEQMHQMFSS